MLSLLFLVEKCMCVILLTYIMLRRSDHSGNERPSSALKHTLNWRSLIVFCWLDYFFNLWIALPNGGTQTTPLRYPEQRQQEHSPTTPAYREMAGRDTNPVAVIVMRGSLWAQQRPSSAFCTRLSGQLLTTMGPLFLLAQAGKQKHGENISYSDKIKCNPCSDESHEKHLGFHSGVCALLPGVHASPELTSTSISICVFIAPQDRHGNAGVLFELS